MMRVGLIPNEKGGTYRLAMLALSCLGLLIAALPVVIVVIMSFAGSNRPSFPPSSYSLRWYGDVLHMLTTADANGGQSVARALQTSLIVAFAVMVISAAVCVPLSYAMARGPARLRQTLEILFTLPLVFPLVMLGIAFLLMAEGMKLDLGLWRLIIPHVTLVLPFVMRNCQSAMAGIDPEVEEAARSLGAPPWRGFLDVVVPMMRPGILAGLIFALIISFNEFTITFFMYTIDVNTLPIWMYSRTVSSLDPSVLALSVFIILADSALIILTDKIVAGKASLF
ncbi:ABC transporter permease [Thioclava sp. GXIMD4215]|uniref:ABC transporter permease n=1 Tax=Thioclava sp. GXIMD4215 TaxID=3131928 RepID=UPI00324A4366